MAERRGSLAVRIALAFVFVGLTSAIIVAGTVALTSRSQTSALTTTTRHRVAASVRSALGAAYRAAGDWQQADLTAAARRSSATHAGLVVRDRRDAIVAVFSPTGQATPGAGVPRERVATETIGIRVGGRQVGTAQLRFAGSGLSRGERHLRDALVRSAIRASLAAALIALLTAAFVTRRIRGPLRRLAGAARGLESGDERARVADPRAPGELGEVAVAFDHMADTLADQRRERAAMLSDLAHELRTPLTILRGSLEELLDGDTVPDPPQLTSLQEEVLRLERLTNDIWALSESEPSFLTLDLARVDLLTVAGDAATALQPRARSAGLTLTVTGHETVILGDRLRLGQVAANLLTNAIKFTPEGGAVAVDVGTVDGCAQMTVTDTGPGIPADELPHLFERFWRGRSAQTVSGTGIGLAVVKRLAEAHGGTVTADSQPAPGARFVVRIPIA